MKLLKYIILLTLPILFVACEDTLTLQDPTQISEEDALADGGIEGVAITMYNSLQGTGYYGARMNLVADVMADNSTATFSSNRYASEYDVTPTSSIGVWGACYESIQAANTLLFYVDEAPGITEQRRASLKGEGHFIRALAYHDLVKSFAFDPTAIGVPGFTEGVIIRTEPVRGAAEADLRERSSITDVYALIVEDLQMAIANLDNSGGNFRATRAAAHALLARVYAHQANWNGVINEATAALTESSATLVPAGEYLASWRGVNHPEAIFELRYDPVLENVGGNNSMASVCTPLFWGDLALTEDLMALFEPTDERRELFFEATVGTGTFMYQSKWVGSTGTTEFDENGVPLFGTNSTFSDNVPMLRVSEMLLLRAEAYAETNQDGLAQADVNAIRAARGVGNITSSGASLVDDILDERRRELMFEGHRWFTLKRKGRTIPKPDGNANPITPDNFKYLSPIPIDQVLLNTNLVQNPGY